MLVRTIYLSEMKSYYYKEIEETYLAPDAANMSAHSFGSTMKNNDNENKSLFTNHKVQHEIEEQNLHTSNQVDNFCS